MNESKVYLTTTIAEKDKIEELRKILFSAAQMAQKPNVYEMSEILRAKNKKQLIKLAKKYEFRK